MTIIWTILLMLAVVNVTPTAAESIDHGWQFMWGDDPAAQNIEFDDTKWQAVDLPHDWSIAGPIARENPSGSPGGFFPTGIGWYRKRFDVPANWTGKSITIQFDGVYLNSEVWLNGNKVGAHRSGFSPFSLDLSQYLKPGEKNVLAVRVDNSSQPNCRWYSGSGIYRHVRLDVREPIHFAEYGISISTKQLAESSATASIQFKVENKSLNKEVTPEIKCQIYLADQNGESQELIPCDFTAPTGQFPTYSVAAYIPHPKPWSPDSPNLYVAVLKMLVDGKEVDTRRVTFGLRTIEVSTEKGFVLNAKPIELFGACVHDDNGPLGTAAYDRAEVRRAEQLKSAGFNAVRCAHNPPAPAFLDACDRLGLLVIDEAFDTWSLPKTPGDFGRYFNDLWQDELDAMILRDRNHPSIVIWSLGNEILLWGRQTHQSALEGQKLIARAKQLDPTRFTTTAAAGWNLPDGPWNEMNPLLSQFDVVGYNYAIHRYESDHNLFPNRVIIGTESFPRELFETFDRSDRLTHVIGDFVWTGIDYLGESGIGRYHLPDEKIYFHTDPRHYPYHGAYCGDIDITGLRKPISHFRNITWDRGEKLYTSVTELTPDGRKMRVANWGIVPSRASWTWPGFEGKTMEVQVYSRYESVRLYLNEKLIGEQPTTRQQQFHTIFSLPYEPGTLRTAGVKDGKEVETNLLQTAGPVAGLRLTPDRTKIAPGGEDLSFITIESVDENGNFQPNGETDVHFTVKGAGKIVGVASADLGSLESYQASQRKLFQGRAILVIRSSDDAGVIHVLAEGNSIHPASTEISVRE